MFLLSSELDRTDLLRRPPNGTVANEVKLLGVASHERTAGNISRIHSMLFVWYDEKRYQQTRGLID